MKVAKEVANRNTFCESDCLIKGQKSKAIQLGLAFLLLPCLALVLLPYVAYQTRESLCEGLLGLNLFFITLVVICYVLPAWLFGSSIWGAFIGQKVIKYGYFPPKDSILFFDTVAKKGKLQTFRGWCLLLLPIVTLCVVLFGHSSFLELNKIVDIPYKITTCS